MLLAAHLLPYTDPAGHEICDPLYAPPLSGAYSFRFRRRPDGSVGSVALGPQSFFDVPVREFIVANSGNGGCRDIVIAILAAPVSHILPMRVELEASPTVGAPLVEAGWGFDGAAFGQGSRGRLLVGDATCQNNGPFISVPSPFDPPFPPGPNQFDSGGALLAPNACGGYRLVGVIAATTGGTSTIFSAGAFRAAMVVSPENCMPRPVRCSADINLDGLLDPNDLADFINAYFFASHEMNADFNGDGSLTPDDLSDFIAAYFAGCP